jgi:hypothetical protein
VNWDADVEESRKEEEEDHSLPQEESLHCPLNECIICRGISGDSPSNPPPRKFPPKRMDSVRRHLIDIHLANAHDGIRCTWKACCDLPVFIEVAEFLAHAVKVHEYDVNIKLSHLAKRQRVSHESPLTSSPESSIVWSDRPGTETPLSSVDLEMDNTDPRLLTTCTASLPN